MVLSGVNKVCAQCALKCKQFAQMILVNCPKIKPVKHEKRKAVSTPPQPTRSRKALGRHKKKGRKSK